MTNTDKKQTEPAFFLPFSVESKSAKMDLDTAIILKQLVKKGELHRMYVSAFGFVGGFDEMERILK